MIATHRSNWRGLPREVHNRRQATSLAPRRSTGWFACLSFSTRFSFERRRRAATTPEHRSSGIDRPFMCWSYVYPLLKRVELGTRVGTNRFSTEWFDKTSRRNITVAVGSGQMRSGKLLRWVSAVKTVFHRPRNKCGGKEMLAQASRSTMRKVRCCAAKKRLLPLFLPAMKRFHRDHRSRSISPSAVPRAGCWFN